jgi:hypothetical protein
VTLTFGPGPNRAIAGGGLGLGVSAPVAISNVRCISSNGDPVVTSYDFMDWNVYGWHAWLEAKTVGVTTISCTAEPNASGSTTVSIRMERPVTVRYVRNSAAGSGSAYPLTSWKMDVYGGFRTVDGATEFPGSCASFLLGWNEATQTLTCSGYPSHPVPVDVVNAICIEDPASQRHDFQGGAVFANDTLLAERWSGSTRTRVCMLFQMDADGHIGPPR